MYLNKILLFCNNYTLQVFCLKQLPTLKVAFYLVYKITNKQFAAFGKFYMQDKQTQYTILGGWSGKQILEGMVVGGLILI